MNKTKEFSVADGIATQREQLIHWKWLLKPEIYIQVEEWAISTNKDAKTGTDIKRGVDLDNFIQNLHYNKRNQFIEKKNELRELIADIIEKHPELEAQISDIASISYDNVNVDTDLHDCIQAIQSIELLAKNYKDNQLIR